MNNRAINSFFGKAQLAPVGFSEPFGKSISPVVVETTFMNFMVGQNLSIGMRDGLKVTLKSKTHMHKNCLIIRRYYEFKQEVCLEAFEMLAKLIETKANSTLAAMKEAYELKMQKNDVRNRGCWSVVVDYEVHRSDLIANNGTIYHYNTDIVVSLDSKDTMINHPFSEEGVNDEATHHNLITDPKFGFVYGLELVDNNGTYGPRFINVNNQVHKVETAADFHRRDGIYITTNVPTGNENSSFEKRTVFAEFDQDKDLGLYKTVEEARTYGNAELFHKLEIAKADLERSKTEQTVAQMKSESQLEKHLQELVALEKQNEQKVLDAANAKHADELKRMREEHEAALKMQRERQTFYYEDRSRERQDSSEGVKSAISLTVSLVTLGVTLFKAFK